MPILDFLGRFNPFRRAAKAPSARASAAAARALAGGRLSIDTEADAFFGPFAIVAPENPEDSWRLQRLDSQTLSRTSPAKLLEYLADLSPDVSRALWDFLRLCNPGWECQALRPGSDAEDATAQAALDAFWEQIGDRYGSKDVPINRLFLAAFLRGGMLAELVLDDAGRTPIDLATPDPQSLRFKRVPDPQLGLAWQMIQQQVGGLVPLDRPTIRYVPVDPLPGKPWGRPLAAPALFSTLFLIGLLHDLRRVVQQQGYPRLDLEIDLEALAAGYPALATMSTEEVERFVGAFIKQVQDAYGALEPDDAYIHTSPVKVNRPVGTVDSDSLGAISGLIEALERMAMRALKSMPIMMGLPDGSSEAASNRQWEIMAAGVKSLQHLAEGLLERLLTLGLQAQGIAAVVRFRFAELRAAELMRDAQVETLKIANARALYDNGWASQNEAANQVVGHDADVPEPRNIAPAVTPGNLLTAKADPGSERSALVAELRKSRRDVRAALTRTAGRG